jgi:hypothetical protein
VLRAEAVEVLRESGGGEREYADCSDRNPHEQPPIVYLISK